MKYVKIDSVDSLYLIFHKVNGCFQKIKGNRYLTLVPTNKSKEKIKKYEELWSKIRDSVRLINRNSDEIPALAIVVRAVFHENNKFYPQVVSDECLYKI